MVDPLAALGLAGNIVQFVDFSYNLLSESRALYTSAEGALTENVVIEEIAKDINLLNDKLTAPAAQGAIPDSLRDLASRCKEIAKELLQVLESIKVKGPDRKWRSFLQALKSVTKRERIETLVRMVDSLRNQMQARLQAIMNEQQSEILAVLKRLADEGDWLEINRATQLQTLIEEVKHAVSRLGENATVQDVTVKDLFATIQTLQPVDDGVLAQISHDMKELSSKLTALATESRSVASEQALLKSLWFKSMKNRHANVAPAAAKTFDWIFDPTSKTRFLNWLQSQNGIYWVMGKAGSGKSTLLKHILAHDETEAALRTWAGPKRLVTAKYFFWNAGTELQKSQQGLFQTLLYEVLRHCPDLIRPVCSSRLKDCVTFGDEPEPWTQPQLWEAISELKKQTEVSTRFCFFIDGLDEYNGTADEIAKVLQDLCDIPDIKLCISSRPWNEFKEAFGRPGDPQLALEDLTRDDIRIFVRDQLEENERYKRLKARDGRCQELVQEIVDKARGVFLWVLLVVRSLLAGMANADRITDLQRRLRQLPPRLEDFFRQMLDSVEDIYKESMAQTFQIALHVSEPLSLLTYAILDEEDLDSKLQGLMKPWKMSELSARREDMIKRLNGRCKGLLEVSRDGSLGYSEDYVDSSSGFHVEFLHRTVRDFLLTKEMQELLVRNLPSGFHAATWLCKASLAHMKFVDMKSAEGILLVEDLLFEMADYAREFEVEFNVPQTALLDEAQRTWSRQTLGWDGKLEKSDILGRLVQRGLRLYVSDRLAQNPELVKSGKIPLLQYALQSLTGSLPTYFSNPQMVRLLLDYGADPNQKYEDSTVWGHFVLALYKTSPPRHFLPTTAMLLKHGANPHVAVVVGTKTVALAPETGRAAQLHQGSKSEVKIYRTASDMIRERLPGLNIDAIIERYQPPKPKSTGLG